MSIFDSVLEAVADLAERETKPYAPILIGPLPTDNGISMSLTSGTSVYFMDKCAFYDIPVTLNGKHAEQRTVSDTLGRIHTALSRLTEYPTVDNCQILSVETQSSPSYLDREDGGQWLYGSSLRVKFYHGKED